MNLGKNFAEIANGRGSHDFPDEEVAAMKAAITRYVELARKAALDVFEIAAQGDGIDPAHLPGARRTIGTALLAEYVADGVVLDSREDANDLCASMAIIRSSIPSLLNAMVLAHLQEKAKSLPEPPRQLDPHAN